MGAGSIRPAWGLLTSFTALLPGCHALLGRLQQIDEFLETGKFAVLEEEGGKAAQIPSKAAADAAPFLNL